MRLTILALFALVFAVSALAWDKNDYEIFDLVSALQASEGKGTTFYSVLGLETSATTPEITKAYRRKSLQWHPDKNPGVKDIEARFARLGVIAQILRDGERRERYNFFLKNGVPTWKGFGYAYTRWRPGLGFVFTFLAVLTAGMHYIVLRLNYARDVRRVEYFKTTAQRLARGAQGRRKVKVPMVEGAVGGEGLELVVDGEDVFLPHDDGSLAYLDELATLPSVLRTWPFRLIIGTYRRFVPAKEEAYDEGEDEDEDEDDNTEATNGFEVPDPDTPTPAPRPRGRAAELRALRQKKSKAAKGKGGSSGRESGDSTPAESTAAEDSEADAKRKPGAGKAAGARRRKLAMKK
ncbi:putative J domain-containing protein [Vanrija pseudolonga]|uniref:Purtative J domain-containing protein n=1 Tax=Vanrija pseudolonga TaxID=143232 RepID=A0AAF0YH83_9TREE|nr:purtative J domain-containing protein [Vanrija pseudolonga]